MKMMGVLCALVALSGCGYQGSTETKVITIAATTPDGKQQQRQITVHIVNPQ